MQATHHSADVRITLTLVDGQTIQVRQLGQDFLIAEDGAASGPDTAILTVIVDRVEAARCSVFLPKGIHPGVERTKIEIEHP